MALAVLLPNLILVWARFGAPADGTGTFPSSPPWGNGVVLSGAWGPARGLQAGDRVVAVAGRPVADWVSHGPEPGSVRPGRTLIYQVSRSGRAGTIEVPVTLGQYPLWEIARARAALHPLLVVLLVIGGFVYLRRPQDPAARALFRIAVLTPAGLLAFPYSTQVIDVLTGRLWPLVLSDTASLVLWGAVLHFTLVFPEPWWIARSRPRTTAAAAYGLPVALYLLHLVRDLPGHSEVLTRLGIWVTISVPAANVVPPLAALALVTAYLRTRDAEGRRRLRWVYGTLAAALVGYLALGRIPEWIGGKPLVPWDWQTLFFLPFPFAIAVAVMRYRLFEVQVIVRRSLVYTGLATGLVLLYLAAALGIGAVTGTSVSLAPLAAGALVVALVLALRERLRPVVMHLVFGHRDDPYEVVRRLGARLEATAGAETVLRTVAETLAQTLRLSYAAVELNEGDWRGASVGSPDGQPRVLPLTHLGEEVGRLVLDTGTLREPFGEADERLLDGITRQVGMTAHSLLLSARLQRSLERAVLAREEERRRLRRDIHDGIGPTLASASMRLELARRMLRKDPDAAESVLNSLDLTQRQALDDMRLLVDGLRPPALDQLGLAGALRERVDRLVDEHAVDLVTHLDVTTELGPLPAAVEVAAYHIVSEALTNVLRHAQAQHCEIRIERRDGTLRLDVADDGNGLPGRYRAGVGLNSIRERAGELGGTATIRSTPGRDTTVTAELPLPATG